MYESLLQQVTPDLLTDFPYVFHSLNLSFIVLLVPVTVWLIKYFYFHSARNSKKPITNKMLFLTSVCLVLSVSCLRFCTYLYASQADENLFELIVNSLIQAVRGIALDENFVDVLETGKAMIADFFPDNANALTAFSILYNVTNVLTPVFGGAFVFNAIIKFLPRFKLRISFFKKQYYFSELNDRSLALAASIADQKISRWKRPLLVFTDTYVDEDSEKSNELYQAATRIGAICLNDDIVHFHVPTIPRKWFFLIDEKEIDNIHALAALAAEAKPSHIRGTQVFVFYQNDAYALTEKRILDSIDAVVEEKYKGLIDFIKTHPTKKIIKKVCEKNDTAQPTEEQIRSYVFEQFVPGITRVRDYENLVFLLLRDIPLFAPLLRTELRKQASTDKESTHQEPQLNVSILGGGSIGMQMLLSSSWCGQIHGHSLGLNMVSVEECDMIRKRIEQIAPEFLESTKKDSDLLRIYNGREDRNKPYFTFRYAQADLCVQNLADISCVSVEGDGSTHSLLDSDYYLVALGSDEQNIATAELLARKIAVYHKQKGIDKDVDIVMMVYDPQICALFERNKDLAEYTNKNIHIHPYGSLEFIYSIQNITLIRDNPDGVAMNRHYASLLAKQNAGHQADRSRQKKVYDAWSSLARAFHLNYRVYSANRFLQDPICANEKKALLSQFEITPDVYEHYHNIAVSKESPIYNNALSKYLGWLEHRRWMAYIRSIGFIQSADPAQKDIVLKLHNCLVETAHAPYCRAWNADGTKGDCEKCRYREGCTARFMTTDENGKQVPMRDKLDDVSIACKCDYKKYDYPCYGDKKLKDNIETIRKKRKNV